MSAEYRGHTIPAYTDSPPSAEDAFRDFADSPAIPIFATAAERDAALPSPPAGDACYVQDVDEFQVHDGTAWRNRLPSIGYAADFSGGVTTGYIASDSWVSTADNGSGGSLTFPSVTIRTGEVALVLIAANHVIHPNLGGQVLLSFGVTGASSIAASDANGATVEMPSGTFGTFLRRPISAMRLMTGLTPGSNTFKVHARILPSLPGSGPGGFATISSPRIAVVRYT